MTYKRLYEVLNPNELSIIKMALSSTNIKYRILFEHTLQIASTYALGNSGAIIEVADYDFKRAKSVLYEMGIQLDYEEALDKFIFIDRIDRFTKSFSLVRRLSLGYRVLLFLTTILVLPTLLFFLNMNRISMSELQDHHWCVNKITFMGKDLHLSQPASKITFSGLKEKCQAELYFTREGMIGLPSFGTFRVRGYYKRHWNILVIEDLEVYSEIYEGEYRIRTNWWGTMKFVSPTTTIVITR